MALSEALRLASPLSPALDTGCTSGIGLKVACRLVEMGVRTPIINGLDVERGERACAIIQFRAPTCDVIFAAADVSTLSGVASLAEGCRTTLPDGLGF